MKTIFPDVELLVEFQAIVDTIALDQPALEASA
jgi:hypothetical protein